MTTPPARGHALSYDELGRTRTAGIESDEAAGPGHEITRSFQYNPAWGAGTFTRWRADTIERWTQVSAGKTTTSKVMAARSGPFVEKCLYIWTGI